MKVRLSAPSEAVFWVSVALAAAGLVLPLLGIPVGRWALAAAYAVLLLGNLVRDW